MYPTETDPHEEIIAELDRRTRWRGVLSIIIGVAGLIALLFVSLYFLDRLSDADTRLDLTETQLAVANAKIKELGGEPAKAIDIPGTDAKVVPVPGRDGERGPRGPEGPRGEPGRDGEDGRDGSDGIAQNGQDGQDGDDGTDGQQGPEGPAGPQGAPGEPGSDGRGISDIDCDDDGRFVISYTDGTTDTVGEEGACTEDGLLGP